MKLEQSFEVAAPLERVWQTLIDVEHVAPCLPGAAVTGRNDDGSYNGTFTVKIGPTTASYTGRLEMESIDEAAHTATMQAQGTDKRGQGGAKATIFSRLAPADGTGTRVEVVTDYHITGRLARFGRGGMIEDISERLLREFAKRLQSSLTSEPDTAEAPAAEALAGAGKPASSGAAEAPTAAGAPETPTAAAPGTGASAGEPEAPVSPGGEAAATPTRKATARRGGRAAASAGADRPAPTKDEATAAPGATESAPPEAPVSPAADVTPPPPPPSAATPDQPAAASDQPAPPPPPSPGPPPVVTPPPAPEAAPPPPPAAASGAPLEQLPEPSEPMQGLSLVGGVLWSRIKRNPAPAAAAAGAVVLLIAWRRRR